MKTIAQKITDLQSKSQELDSRMRIAVEKEANALLRRMGETKTYTYGELCSCCVSEHTSKKDVYSLSKPTLALRTVKKYEYIRKMDIKICEIEGQLYQVEKLFKGE